MKTKLTGILFLITALTGCVKETLDKCPEGDVRIHVYVEKFQTNSAAPTTDAEEIFNQRVQFLHCILYKDNKYVMDTTIADVTSASGPYFSFLIPRLDFGNYELVIIGNCQPEIMRGDFHIPGDMRIAYPGVTEMQDLFAAQLLFTVDCDCTEEFQTKLRRLEGVIHFSFKNLPTDVTEAEVSVHGVNSSLGKGGIYSTGIEVKRRMPIHLLTKSTDPGFMMGVFPITPGTPAAFKLKLFRDSGNNAVFDQVVTDQVNVTRNQLVELLSDFSNGGFSFEIKLDTLWKDLINGGEVEAP